MREHSIAVIPGDGIEPEVIVAGLQVLARGTEIQRPGFTFRKFPGAPTSTNSMGHDAQDAWPP